MIKKKLFSVVCAVIILASLTLSTFAHSAKVEIEGENEYKMVKLPVDVLTHANPSLSDLRLLNEKGEIVPYFLFGGSELESTITHTYSMSLVDEFIKDDYLYYDFWVDNIPERDIVNNGITFLSEESDFAKQASLQGSHDGVVWSDIMSGKVYKIDDYSGTHLEFPQPEKYTYYRLILDNSSKKVSFFGAELLNSTTTVDSSITYETISPEYTVSQDNTKTIISITGINNLLISKITVDSNSQFNRSVTLPNGSGTSIHNIIIDGQLYSSLDIIPMSLEISEMDNFAIKIENHDDKPIDISGLQLTYYSRYIIFKGELGKKYTLSFSGDRSTRSPIYDIVNYKDKILGGEIDDVNISNVVIEAPSVPTPEKDYTALFNIVVIVVAVVLGMIIILSLKNGKKSEENTDSM